MVETIEKTRKKRKKVPRVEKDNTRRPKPRAEWGLLGCVIAFSTLSGVTRESMLLLVTVKENGRQGCGTPDGRLLLIQNRYLRFVRFAGKPTVG